MDVEVAAISVDNVQDAGQMRGITGAEFPILADSEMRVVREYSLYNLLGDGVSAPATIIVGPHGTVVWRYVGQNAGDRPPVVDILQHLQKLPQR